MTDLTGAEISWRGTTLYGSRSGGRFAFETLEGWEEQDSRRESHARPTAHGAMGSAPLAEGRTVRVSGLCCTPAERDAMLAELGTLFAFTDEPDAPTEDLSVTLAGRTLTIPAWVSRYVAPLDLWGAGLFRWRVEFQSDDFLRYGSPVSQSATFQTRTGGLVFPLFPDGVMDFGAASSSNRLTLVSPGGTAAASVQHEVTGPVDASGFEIVEVGSGARLVFEGAVPSSSRLLLDGANGNVLMDGLYDRGDVLTRREWTRVAPGASVEFAFIRRGADIGGAPALSSTLRPAFW